MMLEGSLLGLGATAGGLRGSAASETGQARASVERGLLVLPGRSIVNLEGGSGVTGEAGGALFMEAFVRS